MTVCTCYDRLPGFEYVYLEDSYVLDIRVADTTVQLDVDAVLLEEHPQYVNPGPNEQYCFARGRITFPSATSVKWIDHRRPIADASGDVDFGNIDRFCLEDDHYRLDGDWGSLDITGAPPVFIIDSDVVRS